MATQKPFFDGTWHNEKDSSWMDDSMKSHDEIEQTDTQQGANAAPRTSASTDASTTASTAKPTVHIDAQALLTLLQAIEAATHTLNFNAYNLVREAHQLGVRALQDLAPKL